MIAMNADDPGRTRKGEPRFRDRNARSMIVLAHFPGQTGFHFAGRCFNPIG
jgi:hypothetical protein